MLFAWRTWNRDSWLKPQGGPGSSRLACQTRESSRGGQPVKREPEADRGDKVKSGHGSGRGENTEERAAQHHGFKR